MLGKHAPDERCASNTDGSADAPEGGSSDFEGREQKIETSHKRRNATAKGAPPYSLGDYDGQLQRGSSAPTSSGETGGRAQQCWREHGGCQCSQDKRFGDQPGSSLKVRHGADSALPLLSISPSEQERLSSKGLYTSVATVLREKAQNWQKHERAAGEARPRNASHHLQTQRLREGRTGRPEEDVPMETMHAEAPGRRVGRPGAEGGSARGGGRTRHTVSVVEASCRTGGETHQGPPG